MTSPPIGDSASRPPRLPAIVGHFAWPLAFAALAILCFEFTDVDFRVSDVFFDRALGDWPYRKDFLVREILHDDARAIVFVIAVGSLALAIASIWRRSWRRYWRAALYLALSIALAAAVTGFLKHRSAKACPWDVDRYGGRLPHLSLFESAPPGTELGQCFPAAHAAGAFAFMALFFIYRRRNPRAAWYGLAAGIVAGNAYGFVQVVRGAHFLSHQVWAGILSWWLCAALYWCVFRGRLWPDER
jgi:membrane-associated PAP2 superfamily phosphatase